MVVTVKIMFKWYKLTNFVNLQQLILQIEIYLLLHCVLLVLAWF